MKTLQSLISLTVFTCVLSVGTADVSLPSIFSNNMVLQQQKPIRVWGWADAGEKVTVEFGGESQSTVADKHNKWAVTLSPCEASNRPAVLRVIGNNTIAFKNVLVGEVWVCSGQSNMVWKVRYCDNAKKEIAEADYPEIRLYSVSREVSVAEAENCRGQWVECSPTVVRNFSAAGYYFGREIHKNLKVPIGLISSNWGGTKIEAWMPMERLEKIASMAKRVVHTKKLTNPATFQSKVREYKRKAKEHKTNYSQTVQKAEDPELAAKYSSSEFNDSAWKTMHLPCTWTQGGLADYDGYVWFRKSIEIPDTWAGRDIVLKLGPVDEVDVTWFNGVKVGGKGSVIPRDTRFWKVARIYRVPGKYVKAGKNVIASRVADTYDRGGFWGLSASEMYCQLADQSKQEALKISLAGKWKYLPTERLPKAPANPSHPNLCSMLYNGMIHPLVPFGVRGVIWYQGESNAGRGYQYRELMPALIESWRQKWDDQSMVFIQTQLANFQPRAIDPVESAWAELRESQLLTALNDPKGGMAVTIDIGDADDIHPRNKQDVGKRLALIARKVAYKQDISYQGPVFKAFQIRGKEIRLKFSSVFEGLVARGGTLKGFAIAGEDKEFVWAKARIEGEEVIVSSDQIANPVAVRYGWSDNPECTLYNKAGLPATPFRTDNWKLSTLDKH